MMTATKAAVRAIEFDVDATVMDLYSFYFGFVLRRMLWLFILVPPVVISAQGFATGDFSFVPFLAKFPWPHVWVILLLFSLFVRPYSISRSLLHKDPFRF